jgi:hypothetical protein
VCGCCITGMNDKGLLHLATHMPQLLQLDVAGCRRISLAARHARSKPRLGEHVVTRSRSWKTSVTTRIRIRKASRIYGIGCPTQQCAHVNDILCLTITSATRCLVLSI